MIEFSRAPAGGPASGSTDPDVLRDRGSVWLRPRRRPRRSSDPYIRDDLISFEPEASLDSDSLALAIGDGGILA
jgi:hypothetical protein